jgi:hypothetical protein
LENSPLIQKDHPIGHHLRLEWVVSDMEKSDLSLFLQPPHPLAHRVPQRGIQWTERFIQQQEFGRFDQRAGQGQKSLLPPGQFTGTTAQQWQQIRNVASKHLTPRFDPPRRSRLELLS